ncbi:MAG: DUF512 domain-containing protein [Clostridium sp.]
MKNIITKVEVDSIAEEIGIEVNDVLLSINGTEIEDVIDYKFLIEDEELVLDIEKPNGEVWSCEIEKDYDEDLGLEFGGGLMDKAKSCTNKCMFCFIDQLPKGMRDTLYFKDDDSRLSFLQGNFVTLTNMKDEDIERIIRYRISPINVSVHTTNPELRVKMLKNRFAGDILSRLKRLCDAGIEVHTQIVCIPEVNNGEELKKTILDLYELYPSVQNVAVVPIGVTKFREGLAPVKTFTKETSKQELGMIKELQEKFKSEIDSPFVRLSDEFYLVAGEDVPDSEFYDGFRQIEDGVGMIRYYRDTINDSLETLEKKRGHFTLASGKLAYSEVKKAAEKIMKENTNLKLDVFEIINYFFGETITVTGLLTGKDIIEQLKDKISSKYLILPDNMFRKGYELAPTSERIMLDDTKIEDLENQLDVKVIVCDYTGDDFIDILNTYSEEEI